MSFCFTVAELEFVRNPAPDAGKKLRTPAQQTRSPWLRQAKAGASHYLSSTTQKILGW